MVKRTQFLLSALLAGGVLTAVLLLTLFQPNQVAEAAVYGANASTTYKEYWVDHSEFPGNCEQDGLDRNEWYAEPNYEHICYMSLVISDDFSSAISAEIYMDLWRNRDNPRAQYQINDGVLRTTNVGSDWSRTPYVEEIPLDELIVGENIIAVSSKGSPYHLHDMALRIYYDDANPLVGVDTDAPDGALIDIQVDGQSFDPQTPATLDVDNNQITLVATATVDAQFIEFHAFYDGYDVDNDGQFQDWHAIGRNNWHSGGTPSVFDDNPNPLLGGTISHIGTVEVGSSPTATYSVTWDIPHIVAQDGVRFKVRVVDSEGNANDAAGGASAEFSLTRSYAVLAFRIPDFEDTVLHHGGLGAYPTEITRTINIPVDPAEFETAYVLGMYYNHPFIVVNDNTRFPAYGVGQTAWSLAIREFDVNYLQQGDNDLRYEHRDNSWGEFIEKPGPMIILVQAPPEDPDTEPPFVFGETPADDEMDVADDSSISLHISDLGDGVDSSTISMQVNGTMVTPTISGNSYDYLLTHTPSTPFLAGQLVTVQVEATDLAGNAMTTHSYSFTVLPPATDANFVSDDFNSCFIDARWTEVNPLNDATITLNDELTNLIVDVPAAIAHDFSATLQNAPHLLQDVADGNFDVTVKVGSLLGDGQQLGLLALSDSSNFVRAVLSNSGGTTGLTIETIEAGVVTVEAETAVANTNPIYLRLTRSGVFWQLRYSFDNSSWVTVGQFNHALTLEQIGLFAGNLDSAPAHTAVFDDFFNVNSPIDPEDAQTLLLPINQVGNGTVLRSVDCGLPLTLQAVADPGWEFGEWLGSPLDGSSDANPTINSLTAGDEVTAVFEALTYTLDLDLINQYSAFDATPVEEGGTLSVEPDQPSYLYGEAVTLTATAAPGWQFDGWTGSQSGVSATLSFTITENSVISGTFTQESYTVSASVEAGDPGSVTVSPDQAGYVYGDVVSITAVSNDSGWYFINWTGDDSSSDNPLVVTLTGDLSVEANFAQNRPPQITTLLEESYTAEDGELFELPIQATDADGDPLTITVENAPDGLTLTDNGDGTATIQWTPTAADDGTYQISVIVSDGENSITQSITIVVEGLQQLFLPMIVSGS